MKRKSTLFLLLTSLLLIAFLVPACQKKYELDDQALLQLQCNASDAESIIEGIGETSETTVQTYESEPTDSSEPTISEVTEVTETQAVTEVSVTETTKATTKATTKKPTEPNSDPSTYVAPVVSADAGTDSVTVTWTPTTRSDLVYYKVVASVSDSTPTYGENGYYTYFTDPNVTSCTIKVSAGYNGGDVGCFSGGTAYYFSVTAVYSGDKKVAGNAVKVTMPGDPATVGTYPASDVISAAISDGKLNVSWSGTTDAIGFEYYKVVVSKSNTNPTYPTDGHWAAISDSTCTSASISMDDHTDIISGDVLSIRITTVYQSGNYAHGTVVTVTVP